MPNLYTSLTAFDAVGVAMQVTSNNIANMNTLGFRSSRTLFEDRPHDFGVRVAGIYRDMSAGPAVVDHLSEGRYRNELHKAAQLSQFKAEEVDNSVVRVQEMVKREEFHNIESGQAVQASRDKFFTEQSNVEAVREFSTMVSLEAMYSANAAAVRAQDEMTGTLLNLII